MPNLTDKQFDRVLNLIERSLDTYQGLLQKIVIEKDKDFNSTPFEKITDSLNYLIRRQGDND